MAGKRRVQMVVRTCQVCDGQFEVYPSAIRASEKHGHTPPRFCSPACRQSVVVGPRCVKCNGPNNRGRRTRVCEVCLAESTSALKIDRARQRLAQCPAGLRWCTVCDRFLDPTEFPSADNLCTGCRATNSRRRHLERTYGLDEGEYQRLLDAQGGVCAICERPPKNLPLAVDHDHKSGLIRGLLCLHCNHFLLKAAKDSPATLRRGADYLESPPAPGVLGDRLAPGRKKPRRRKSKTQ